MFALDKRHAYLYNYAYLRNFGNKQLKLTVMRAVKKSGIENRKKDMLYREMYQKYYEFLHIADMQCRVCTVDIDKNVRPIYPESFYDVLPGYKNPGVTFEIFKKYILKQKSLDRKKKMVSCRSSESLSRTRSKIFELALCNNFSFFATFTFAESKGFNRKNLKECYKAFADCIRVFNRSDDYDIRYLLIPERHHDGSWHLHGLISGLPSYDLYLFTSADWNLSKGKKLPYRIIKSVKSGQKVYSWNSVSLRFGWNTLMPVRSAMGVSKYITKYITKGLSNDLLCQPGSHLYYCSKGLSRAKLCAKGFLIPQNFLRYQEDCFVSDYCCSYSCDYSDSALSDLLGCISDTKEAGCTGYGYDSDLDWLRPLKICKGRDVCRKDTSYRVTDDYKIWEYIRKKFPDISNIETIDKLKGFFVVSDGSVCCRPDTYSDYILYIDTLYNPVQLRLQI